MVIEVQLDLPTPTVALQDAENFRAFKVVARASNPDNRARLQQALRPYGRVAEDGNVFIEVEPLKRLAGEYGSDPAWLESLGAMIAYAAEKGWTDETGAVQAHCEWSE